jgi:Fe-S oxidoreductase
MLKRYILKENVAFKNEVAGGYNFVTFTLFANNMAEAYAKAMMQNKSADIVVIEYALCNIMSKDERYLNPNL